MTHNDQHTTLVAAHRRGDVAAAVAAATELASAGYWDRLVAATLVAHGRDDALLTDRALVELTRIESVAMLAQDPRSETHWQGALAALIDAGRAEEAVTGIRLAAADGVIGPAPWKVLLALLVDAGHYSDAIAAARFAVDANPGDAELQAMRALLACECGQTAESDAALVTAYRLDPRSPIVWVGRARLAFARGDEVTADKALEAARALGADDDVLGWIGRMGRTSVRYGV